MDFTRIFQTFHECVCVVSLVSSLLGSVSSFYHDFVCKIQKNSSEITGGQGENQHYERLVRCLPKGQNKLKKAKNVNLESGPRY